MTPHRAERISEAIREELGELIGYELDDPRIASAAVAEVHVSPDLRHARVELAFSSQEESAPALVALDGARGFLRRELARRLDLRHVPELHFESGVEARLEGRMNSLLKRVRRGRPKDSGGSDQAEK